MLVEIGAGSLTVWTLRGFSVLFFLLGITAGALALFAELAPSSRQRAVELTVAIPAIVVLAAIGVYVGGWVVAPDKGTSAADRFAGRLSRIVSDMSRERDMDMKRLQSAGTGEEQATIAKALAGVFLEHEEMVLRIAAARPASADSTIREIADGLRHVAMAYEKLEAAVLNPSGSQIGVDRARRRIRRAEGRLRDSQMALAAQGHLVIAR